MPKSSRTNRTLAVSVAVSLLGVSTIVALSATGGPTANAAVAPGATVRASVSDERFGPESSGRGYQQELSADGTAVAFTSRAQLDNLRTWIGDTTYQAVYVRDLARGRTVMISRGQFTRPEPPTTTTPVIKYGSAGTLDLGARAAQQSDPEPVPGETPPDGSSYQPTISADGRYVAFVTEATNILEADDDDDRDILICDRDPDGDGDLDENRDDGERDYRYLKVTDPVLSDDIYTPRRIDRVSRPKIADDASRIVWQDVVSEGESRSPRVRTAVLTTVPGGPVTEPTATRLVDGTLPGTGPRYDQVEPDVSSDGRYIVFAGLYSVPAPEGDGSQDVYAIVRNEAGTSANVRVDLDVDLTPVSENQDVLTSHPAISGDGGEIAFTAEALNVEGDLRQPNVYVVRLDGNAPVDSVIVSRDNEGALVNGSSPALSADGRFVAFVTDALRAHDGVDGAETRSCLRWATVDYAGQPMLDLAGVPPYQESRDVRTACQVVVRDLVTDRERSLTEQPRLPSTLASNGVDECGEGGSCAGNADSTPFAVIPSPSLARDGSVVAFDSDATNLVPEETDDNESTDVFVRTFQPELRADPDLLDFGEVELGETVARTARFDHVGIGPLVVDSVRITGEGSASFALGATTCVGEGVVLQQAGSCLVSVEFTPTETGARDAVLHLVAPNEREFTVKLRGTGVEAPPGSGSGRFAAGPDPLDFGARLALSTGPLSTVTVVNRGESPMTVGTVTVEPATARAHFSVAANTCTAPVPAGGSCTVSVAFSPRQTTDLTGALRFDDDTPGAPHLVGLRGSGTVPAIALSPAVSPPGRVITVSGTGFAPDHQIVTTVPGAVQTGPITVAADGTFRGGLLILPKASIGSFPVIAKVADAVTINAQKQLLIVTPTVSPADFVIRG